MLSCFSPSGYNGAFGFKLSVTDYYGAVGNPYVSVMTTQNKDGCDTTTATAFAVADDQNTGATETVSCEYHYTTYLCAVDNGAYASCGVLATLVKPNGNAPSDYVRLGGCMDLPLVLVGGLSHEPTSYTLVAATVGRGVYTLFGASDKVAKLLGA